MVSIETVCEQHKIRPAVLRGKRLVFPIADNEEEEELRTVPADTKKTIKGAEAALQLPSNLSGYRIEKIKKITLSKAGREKTKLEDEELEFKEIGNIRRKKRKIGLTEAEKKLKAVQRREADLFIETFDAVSTAKIMEEAQRYIDRGWKLEVK